MFRSKKMNRLLLVVVLLLLVMIPPGGMAAEVDHIEDKEEASVVNTNENIDSTSFSKVQPQEMESILILTDETFEHSTQASTGQTTGSWLVWFYNSTADITTDTDTTTTPQQHRPLFRGNVPSTEQWLEHHIIVAKINVATNGYQTMLRFFGHPQKNKSSSTMIPSFLYIHHGHMYHVPMVQSDPSPSYYDWDMIHQFCILPNPILAMSIPPPPSILDEIITKLAHSPTLFSGVAVMIMILGAFLGTLVESWNHAGRKKKNPSTTTTVTTATNKTPSVSKKQN